MRRNWIAAIIVTALSSQCGTEAMKSCSCAQTEPEKNWEDQVVFEDEPPWPPLPPDVYKGPWEARTEQTKVLKEAGEQFEEKNFETAMEKYRQFVDEKPNNWWVPHATFQIARCHFQRSEYDEALQLLEKFIEDKPGTLWEARTKIQMSSLYHALPSYGYERNERVYYNYEKQEGEHRYLSDENRDKAIELLEQSRLAYVALVEAKPSVTGAHKDDDLRLEAVDVGFLLMRDIDQHEWEKSDTHPPKEPLDPPDPKKLYDPHWPARLKLLYLFSDVVRSNKGRQDTHPEAWATFKKALFLMSYPESAPAEWYKKIEAEREAHENKLEAQWEKKTGKKAEDVAFSVIVDDLGAKHYKVERWEPPAHLDALKLIDSIIATYPDDKHRELYEATRGRVIEGRGEYSSAEKIYEAFLKKYPESDWKGDVDKSLHDMRKIYLSVSGTSVTYGGDDSRIRISSRNTGTVQVDVYSVDLAKMMTKGKSLKDVYTRFSDVGSYLGEFESARKMLEKKVWSTTVDTRDTGEHQYNSDLVVLPEQFELGTWLVHLAAGKEETILPVIRSDLVVMGKAVKDEIRYVVTDPQTGAPMAGVPLTIKETYEIDWWVTKVKITKAETDENGRYSYKMTLASNISYNRVQLLALQGKSLAVTNTISAPYHYSSQTGKTYRVFTVTDRPVYRPGDRVKFKHIVRCYDNGQNVEPASESVELRVSDPTGATIYDASKSVSKFGGVWGEVTIDEDAPLGVYSARAQVAGHEWRTSQSSGSTFRVEEYKKPEFEVEVLPGKDIAKPGEKVKARIKATYYFGAPVGSAKVKYKVYRSVFGHSYSPPNRWDWMYGKGFGLPWYRSSSSGDDLVDEGEGLTDDLGEMVVQLPAVDEDTEQDFTYKVTAEVTDPSRRVINGEGTLKVTRDPYYSYVTAQHGFYTAGDTVEVEIKSLTADDEPVEARGTVKVARLIHKAAEEPEKKVIDEKKIELDSQGLAFHSFKAEKAGQYEVTFTSTHKGSKEVEGSRIVNVAGASMTRTHFRFGELEVTSEKRTYLRGETIDMLVQSPWENATLWVTYEGGDEVFHDEIIQPEGMAVVLSVEATQQLHPNFFVHVMAVHDGLVHSVEREIFIPPGEEILDVDVSLDDDEYGPRDEAKITLGVKDHEGNPVEGEFSLSVFDKSVTYIQSETAGDIRAYFYGARRYSDISEFHSTQIYLYPINYYRYDDTTYFSQAGLPSTSGSFSEPYLDRGLAFTCPSCMDKRGSPWILRTLAERKKMLAEQYGIDEEEVGELGGIGLGNMGTIGHGGGGGSGVGYGRGSGGLSGAKSKSSAPRKMKKMAEKSPSAAYGIKGPSENADPLSIMNTHDTMAPTTPVDPGPAPDVIRENFVDTALWIPDLTTGKDGKGEASFEWPDNLTTWAVRVFGADGTVRVGMASAKAITTKKLVARIETPRFLMEGDVVTLAAVVNNDHPDERKVELELKVKGGVEIDGKSKATIKVPSGKDGRHDFKVRATKIGDISVTLVARSGGESDALKKSLEVMEWGSDRMVARAGAMQATGTMELTLDIPKQRRVDSTEFVLTLDPTLATVTLKSMPYLIHFPYGCTEQTMSRFLPAAMVARTLQDMDIKLADIPKLAKKASLADPVSRVHGAPQVWYGQPIYSDAKLKRVIKKGLNRLYKFQHSDGGWGWWKDDDSDDRMTAYVLSGLVVASTAGYEIDSYVISRGMSYLQRRFQSRIDQVAKSKGFTNIDANTRNQIIYLAWVLSLQKMVRFEQIEGIWDHRESLSHYGAALLALTLHNIDETEKSRTVVSNLANVAWKDEQSGAASFKFEKQGWWYWYNNRIETVAWALRAFTAIDPEHELGPMFARWLVKNREGNRWFSTKDTAISVLALTEYMKAHDELHPDYDVKVTVNGEEMMSYHVGPDDIFSGKGTLVLRGKDVKGDKLHVKVTAKGKGALYANSFLTYFTKQETIKASGNEISLDRHYYRLHEVKKKVKTWYGEVTRVKYAREELKAGDPINSGDLLEVKILVNSNNDYEYLVFEDFKPAGCEPLQLKSGSAYEHGTWITREMRDEKVVTFIRSLRQGQLALTYKLRAEIPGTFRVLPHNAYAMYAPRIKAISDSWKLVIE